MNATQGDPVAGTESHPNVRRDGARSAASPTRVLAIRAASITDLTGIPWTTIPYGTDEWKLLYRGRAAVEREFGRLKNECGLKPLRTRGIERVRIHADLTMLARLGQALGRTRHRVLNAA